MCVVLTCGCAILTRRHLSCTAETAPEAAAVEQSKPDEAAALAPEPVAPAAEDAAPAADAAAPEAAAPAADEITTAPEEATPAPETPTAKTPTAETSIDETPSDETPTAETSIVETHAGVFLALFPFHPPPLLSLAHVLCHATRNGILIMAMIARADPLGFFRESAYQNTTRLMYTYMYV